MSTISTQLYNVTSKALQKEVPVSVIFPDDFSKLKPSLPILISLDGGGGDRLSLINRAPLYQQMFAQKVIPPMVVISFSGGADMFYYGDWEQWICDELPLWAQQQFATNPSPQTTFLTGISMGAYGALKTAFKNPQRFAAVAALEPTIMPCLQWPEQHTRPSWWMFEASVEAIWGSPFKPNDFMAEQPANIVCSQGQAIRDSGIEIYLEVGDQDYLQLHDGCEFLHRVLWDHDIAHEYKLLRWAAHAGLSLPQRIIAAHQFIGDVWAGGKTEAIDIELTSQEQAHIQWIFGGRLRGEPAPDFDASEHPEREAALHAALFKPLRNLALRDKDMERNFAKLPATTSL